MNQYDPALAQRVWQRVQGDASGSCAELLPLITGELTNAELYRKGNYPALYRQARRTAACLQGVYRLMAGAPAHVTALPEKPSAAALFRCYSRCLSGLAFYRRHTDDPEYGAAFSQLAQQTQTQCGLLLEVIGNLP